MPHPSALLPEAKNVRPNAQASELTSASHPMQTFSGLLVSSLQPHLLGSVAMPGFTPGRRPLFHLGSPFLADRLQQSFPGRIGTSSCPEYSVSPLRHKSRPVFGPGRRSIHKISIQRPLAPSLLCRLTGARWSTDQQRPWERRSLLSRLVYSQCFHVG